MSKRKRVYFDDDDGGPPRKKLKVVSGKDSLGFLKKGNNPVFKPNELKFEFWDEEKINKEEEEIIIIKGEGFDKPQKQIEFYLYFGSNKDTYKNLVLQPPEVSPKKEEKKKSFSEDNTVKVFRNIFGEGRNISDLKIWCIDDSKSYGSKFEEKAEEANKEFTEVLTYMKKNVERSEESLIEIIVKKVCSIIYEEENMCRYSHQDVLTGREHTGKVDFAIWYGNNLVVIIEAKKNDIDQGTRQLILELKALQEKEKMDKWYYGFAAYGKCWKPLRLNMKKEGLGRVEVGRDILIPEEDQKKYLKKVMYVLNKMILDEF